MFVMLAKMMFLYSCQLRKRHHFGKHGKQYPALLVSLGLYIVSALAWYQLFVLHDIKVCTNFQIQINGK